MRWLGRRQAPASGSRPRRFPTESAQSARRTVVCEARKPLVHPCRTQSARAIGKEDDDDPCRGLRLGGPRAYRLAICINNSRVVFSIDWTSTRVFGLMGAFASLSGLKLSIEFTILADVAGRVCTSTESVLRVASTMRASLWPRGRTRSQPDPCKQAGT